MAFLEKLQTYQTLPSDLVLHLGQIYHFSDSPNPEIRFRYYEVVFQDSSSIAAEKLVYAAIQWVVGEDGGGNIKGRMKFCRSVLQASSKVKKELVLAKWKQVKHLFHPIAQKLIDRVSDFLINIRIDFIIENYN